MIVQRIPLFQKGKILTQEMLYSLKEHSIEFKEAIYMGYADGVLRGCSLSISENTLTMSQGMLIYNSKLYHLVHPLTVNYQPIKQEVAVRIRFLDETRTEDFIYQEAELVLTPLDEYLNHCIELCRFKFQEGAILRNNYQDFADYNTEFNTVNEIYADWSAYQKTSLSPKVLKAFADEVIAYAQPDSMDFWFLSSILNLKGETLNRDVITAYVSKRLSGEWKEYTNRELFEKLLEITQLIKNPVTSGKRGIRNQSVFVS